MEKHIVNGAFVLVALVLIGAGCPTQPTGNASETNLDSAADTVGIILAGSYEGYDLTKLALAKTDKVILFFAAAWCPTCKVADANFSQSVIPAGLHILKVDYDTATELKKKYGVTYQHTFVQVDAEGNKLNKWSGSTTVEEIVTNVQ